MKIACYTDIHNQQIMLNYPTVLRKSAGKTGDGSMSFLNRPLSYRTVPCPICYNEMLFVTFKLPKFALTRIFVYRIILSIINAVT